VLEETRAIIQKKFDLLTSELVEHNALLAKLNIERDRCDAVIKEVEGAYCSIMEASQSLLHTTRSLGTKLDSRYPAREVTNLDTLNEVQLSRSLAQLQTNSFTRADTSYAPPVPLPSGMELTPDIIALHEAGFAPSTRGAI
jgi:hypothetical protein